MNPLHPLTTRVSLTGNRTVGLDRPPLNLAAGAVIALPAEAAIRGLRLGRKILFALLRADDSHYLGACAECGNRVTQSDPFIRYRGDYYHAYGCAETNPPALRRRHVRPSPASA